MRSILFIVFIFVGLIAQARVSNNAYIMPSSGSLPTWGPINLSSSSAVTSILPLINGGTGISSGVSGGILGFTGTATLGSSALLTAGQPVLGGGAGGVPFTIANGTSGQSLISNGAGTASWGNPVSQMNITSKSSNYSAVANDYVLVSAASTITLPTAVGVSGERIGIQNTSTSAANVVVNTTSSQTIGGRASGDIVFRRYNTYGVFISDGANWQIVSKYEHQFLSSSNIGSINGVTSSYQNAGTSIALGIGEWEVTARFALSTASGSSQVTIFSNSGLYQADGANSTVTPTGISSQVDGPVNYNAYAGSFSLVAIVSGAASLQSTPLVTRIIVTSGTQTVFAVPSINYTTASTASWGSYIEAKRIF